MATGRSGNFKFSNPTIWLSSYTYIEWSSILNSDRSYSINVKQWMYVQANNSLSGTWTFSSTIGNNTQYDTTLLSVPKDGIPHTVLLGEYSFTVEATNDRSPSVNIFTYATIDLTGGNGPGTSNASTVAVLDSIPLPTVTTPTVTKIENTVLSTSSKLEVVSSLTNSPYSYYKLRLKYSKYSNMSSSTSIDHDFGITSIDDTIDGLDPYVTYYVAVQAIGLDGNTYVTSTIVPTRTYDLLPVLTTYTVIATTQTDITVQYQVVSNSPVEFSHYKDGIDQLDNVFSSDNVVQYTYSGLSAAVTYILGVILANDGGVTTLSTITADTAVAPPVIVSVTPIIGSTSIQLSVSATASAGVRGYQFSKNNGTTWSLEQVSSTYTFSSLRVNTPYSIKVRVFDNLGLSTTSEAYALTTLFTPPVITGIIVTNITTISASVKVTATSGAGIKSYSFVVTPSTYNLVGFLANSSLLPDPYTGSTNDFYITLDTSYSWAWNGSAWVNITSAVRLSGYTTSSVYTAVGLNSSTSYKAIAFASDNQGTSATPINYEFTTLTYDLIDLVSFVKFTKNLSTELNNIPKVDGNLIVTMDDGRIYLDHKISTGDTVRSIIGTGSRVYTTAGTAPSFTLTIDELPTVYPSPLLTNNYESGMMLYILPHSTASSAITININNWGAKSVIKLDGTNQTSWTASQVRLVVYNDTAGKFVDITS